MDLSVCVGSSSDADFVSHGSHWNEVWSEAAAWITHIPSWKLSPVLYKQSYWFIKLALGGIIYFLLLVPYRYCIDIYSCLFRNNKIKSLLEQKLTRSKIGLGETDAWDIVWVIRTIQTQNSHRKNSFLWYEIVAHFNHHPSLKWSLDNLKQSGLNKSCNFMSHFGYLVIDSWSLQEYKGLEDKTSKSGISDKRGHEGGGLWYLVPGQTGLCLHESGKGY